MPITAMSSPTTRRELLAIVGAVGVLAACGSDGDSKSTAQTRTIKSDTGPLNVPINPQRVVAAVGSFETDMVAVGVMPVLTTSFAGPWVTLDDGVIITSNIPPTVEELAAAKPDLIVGWNWVGEEPAYAQIDEVAPYVGLGETAESAGPGFDGSEPFRSWDTLFLSVCDAVGKRVEGEHLVAEFDKHLDALAKRTSTHAGQTFARIEFYDAGSFSHRGKREDTAELMRRIGLQVVGPDESVANESLERLPDIDADWLIVPVGGGMPQDVFDQVASTDLYKAIPAVQRGQVINVDGTLWSGFGHLWARAIVDDLEHRFF